jgi:raffinose/stachyose/melibiose transport system permease protein
VTTSTVRRVRSQTPNGVTRAARRAPRVRHARREWIGLAYVLPPLAIFGFVIVGPVAYGAWISLFDWNGVSAGRWVGLHNYSAALHDPIVRQALIHSFVLVIFYSAIPVVVGLGLTGIIARHPLRGVGAWRAILFLPQILSVVVVGVSWRWLLQQDGPVNELLRAVGLGSWTRVWLGDFTWALPAEGAIGTWMMSGLCMVLFLAGAQSIDGELYDAADVDGAGVIREFFTVTVPGLRNVIVVASVLTFAVSLNNFSLVWVTTKGGPGTQTQVASTLIYSRAFIVDALGDASALAVLLGIIMMAVSFGLSRLSQPA